MDIVSFSMNPYAARMNTNNFKNVSQFSDDTQNFYKIFHNLLKKTIDIIAIVTVMTFQN